MTRPRLARRYLQAPVLGLDLYELDLPPILAGEIPTWTPPDDPAARRPIFFQPNGTPIVGSPGDPTGALRWAMGVDSLRFVARTRFYRRGVRVVVSTVYLGSDHAFGSGLPLIYETMVFYANSAVRRDAFGDGRDTWRYSTRAAALDGHGEVCQAIRRERLDRLRRDRYAVTPILSLGGPLRRPLRGRYFLLPARRRRRRRTSSSGRN